MTRRFYVEPPSMDGDSIALDPALTHRLSRVLRLRVGDEAVLFDGSGKEARVRIESITDRACRASVIERMEGAPEPRVAVHLYQSVVKGERFEWLVEKGTEVGVVRFVPLIAARAVVKTETGASRIDRWRRIAVEAAEQCGRCAVPSVGDPEPLAEALASAPGVLLLPYEAAGEDAPHVAAALDAEIDALFALSAISIFIGPEGGFEDAEVEQARAVGAVVVTMGRRVLRSETAGLVAATLALQAAGELG